jgi:hypothetical protein
VSSNCLYDRVHVKGIKIEEFGLFGRFFTRYRFALTTSGV